MAEQELIVLYKKASLLYWRDGGLTSIKQIVLIFMR